MSMVMLELSLVLATLVQAAFPVVVYARRFHNSDESKVSIAEEDIRGNSRVLNWRSVSNRADVDPAELHELDRRVFVPHEDPSQYVERLEQETAEREPTSDGGTGAASQGPFMRIHADMCKQYDTRFYVLHYKVLCSF
jgi:hypothetical protein